jgi:4-hydroxy-tetrahydrodipicolinate synthase
MIDIKGIIPAIPTPFTAAGGVNVPELERILAFLIKAGVHGIFAAGNAGEFYALDMEEKRQVLRASLKTADGKIPVFFGAGSAYTEESIRLAQMAEAEGADALSVITPYVIKPSEDELYSYYEAICKATALPVLPYNNPAVTGIAITPRLMSKLATIENIAGVKDSSGDLAVTLEFLRIKKDDFAVLAGRDNLILSTLMHGGKGAISSVASACPELAVGIYNAFISGDYNEALRQQMNFAKLRQLFSLGTFPTVIKAALQIRGFNAGDPRPPVSALPSGKYMELSECLHELLKF